MRIVFMGTPDFAVHTLDALFLAGHNIVGVFAQPDKPVGRKQVLTPPAVKVYAAEKGLRIFQPETLRDGEALSILKELNPEVIVVVAYGKILPKEILELPKYGCVNGHASLLPRHRGASPIQWAILSGDKQTGITTMLMDEGMDTGDILERVCVTIGDEETAEELFDRLAPIGGELMVKTLKGLENGEITPTKQDEDKAGYAPIIKKEMAQIDFSRPAQEIYNAVRGFYSWPCAYFMLDGKRIKVMKAQIGEKTDELPGTVIESRDSLTIACGGGSSIKLLMLRPEGSRLMSAKQMLNGWPIPVGTKI